MSIELIVETQDREMVERLDATAQQLTEVGLEPEEPTRVPGAVDSLYEICATAGVLTVPAGVVSGVVANWLGNVWRSGSPAGGGKLIIRRGGAEMEIPLDGQDTERLTALIKVALSDETHDS